MAPSHDSTMTTPLELPFGSFDLLSLKLTEHEKMNDWNTFFRFHVSFRECTFINSEVYTNSWGTLVNQQVWKLGSAGGFKATWRERTTRWGEATDILVHQSVGNSQNEDIC